MIYYETINYAYLLHNANQPAIISINIFLHSNKTTLTIQMEYINIVYKQNTQIIKTKIQLLNKHQHCINIYNTDITNVNTLKFEYFHKYDL